MFKVLVPLSIVALSAGVIIYVATKRKAAKKRAEQKKQFYPVRRYAHLHCCADCAYGEPCDQAYRKADGRLGCRSMDLEQWEADGYGPI